MHRNKHKKATLETKPASEAMKQLTLMVAGQVNGIIENLGATALRDAGLKSEDGWRYNVQAMQYERMR